MNEFTRIRRFFLPLTRTHPAALSLQDDIALLDLPAGCRLAISADMLAEGVHFRPHDPLDLVARKSLRVNLSDLAAKGARPQAYFLCLCWPRRLPEADMQTFATGLTQDGETYDLPLLGGDLIAGERLTIAITILGSIPAGIMPARAAGQPGDDLYVSGTLGDSALGLHLLTTGRQARQNNSAIPLSAKSREWLQQRYLLPQPRLALGQALAPLAAAAMDISDGLLADLRHICTTSATGAIVEEARLPLSQPARSLLEHEPTLRHRILTGGDDYELLFSANPSRRQTIAALSSAHDIPVTRIGALTPPPDIRLLDADGKPRPIPASSGYRHF